MTGYVFEITTAAIALRVCHSDDPGVLLTDFSCAFPSVDHAGGGARGQFAMMRGVRRGCPASGFLFTMAFDPCV